MARSLARLNVAEGDDTALNMTPMIDVCFQLIVFFMLTLKFPSVSTRFETQLPTGVGTSPRPAEPPLLKQLTVSLFRKDVEQSRERHFTRVRVGQVATVDLPRGPWPQDGEGAADRKQEEDRAFARIADVIAGVWAAQSHDPDLRGEIKTPAPTGQLVPHGDVMRVLDSFVAAGVVHVDFEGAPAPLSIREGGGWAFADPAPPR
jgi:hypothetical protein